MKLIELFLVEAGTRLKLDLKDTDRNNHPGARIVIESREEPGLFELHVTDGGLNVTVDADTDEMKRLKDLIERFIREGSTSS